MIDDRTKRSGRRRLLSAALVLACLFAPPAAAAPLPDPAAITMSADERAMLGTLLSRLGGEPLKPQQRLTLIEAALEQVDQPTELRGFLQYLRGGLLQTMDRTGAAREAAIESIRLLPNYSAPLLLAGHAAAYDNRPADAADYLMRASRIDPEIVREIDEYEINNIFDQLDFKQESSRIGQLSERLLAIGWLGDGLDAQSALARRAIRSRVEAGEIAAARSLVPKLLDPADVRTLLTQRKYEALWPDLESWAGPRLEKVWAIYLPEAEARWRASKDQDYLRACILALEKANRPEAIIRELQSLYAGSIDSEKDYGLLLNAGQFAAALADMGRWNEIDRLYAKTLAAWPLGGHANALNLIANKARYLMVGDRSEAGLAAMDRAIADAARWKGEVNGDALAEMHRDRACMLHRLGRELDGAVSRALVNGAPDPQIAVRLDICLGAPAVAKDRLIALLKDEDTRDDVIAFVQPSDDIVAPSDFGRDTAATRKAVRTDPELLAAVARHGRVLPFTLSEGVPPE